MTPASECCIDLSAGRFRYLEWPGNEPPALLLHGLTALADAWTPLVDALPAHRPHCIALDQRGHGDSPQPETGYACTDYVRDLVEAVDCLNAGPMRLVGHSMGARVALVAAARFPSRFSSVVIVDIGPERWAANWQETVEAVDRMPQSFEPGEALAFFTRNRPTPPERERLYLARLRDDGNGRLTWRGSPDAFKQTVKLHRSRDFWTDWERLSIPALLVRGGTSNELRPKIAEEMRRRNPEVRFVEIEGVGHNIPLVAPERLAAELMSFWHDVE